MKKASSSTLHWIYRRIRRYIPFVLLISLLNAVSSYSFVRLAVISGKVLDAAAHKNSDRILPLGLLMFGIVALQVLLSAVVSALNVRATGKLTISMRNYLFEQLVHKKYPSIAAHHTGDLLNRFTSDIDIIVSMAVSTVPSVVAMLTTIIAGILTLIGLEARLALIVLVVGLIFPWVGRLISKYYKKMHKEVQRTEGVTRSVMQESFANIVVIKSFLSGAPILRKLNQSMSENLAIKIRRNRLSVFMHLCLYSFFTFGYYGVLLWGAGGIAAGAFTYAKLNTFLQLISQLRGPLQNVSGIIPQFFSTLASAERLIELEDIETEEPPLSSPELEELKQSFSSIEVRNLAFAYDKELILRNCSFDIPGHSITAITGESGCGKSTFFRLLLGLYEPSGGSIRFDGKTDVSPATRGMFAYVPQGNMILSGTIRENITMCDNSVTEEQLIRAAKAAAIYDHIMTLPDGFDTVLSEHGAGLSEGQVQRISVARALLSDTPILLLDEATSALDEATETEMLSNIKSMTGKTVLFITHRNTSISVCDHIIHAADNTFTLIK